MLINDIISFNPNLTYDDTLFDESSKDSDYKELLLKYTSTNKKIAGKIYEYQIAQEYNAHL